MKSRIFLVVFALLLAATATRVKASSIDKKALQEMAAGMTQEQKDARLAEMKQRVEEIKSMDKSQLSRIERKELKQELRNMNKEAKADGKGNGIYISLAGLIIIVLLLILIL